MKNHVLSSLVSVLFFGFATAAWADVTIPADLGEKVVDGKLQEDAELAGCGVLTVAAGLDLNGNTLVLKGVTGMSGTPAITSTLEGGVFDLEVTGDFKQTSVLKGKLKLIKRGNKTLTVIENEFSGGMEIVGGTVTPASYGNRYKYYGNPPAVVVKSGATMNLNGCYGFTDQHSITLEGGSLVANRADNNFANLVEPSIRVSANSSLKADKNALMGPSLTLEKDCTLAISVSETLKWKPAKIQGTGTIAVSKGKLTLVQDIGLPEEGIPTACLTLKSGTGLSGGFTYSVKDLTVETTAAAIGSTIAVYETYKPSSATAYMPKMMGRSVLDLSGLEADATVALSPANFGTGTVTIALGDRALEENQKIVSWDAKPEGVTFGFTGTGIEETEFSVTEVGIVYRAVSEGIAVATWIGGESDDWGAATNWDCRNARGERLADAVPDETMTVVVTGDVSALKLSSNFPFAGVRFLNAYLSTSPDWSGFDFGRVTEDSLLDTKGVALELTTWGTSSVTPLTITNTSETEGLLTVNVPEGVLFTNDTLSVSGNLKFVKTGLGTLVAERYPQTYAGETVVKEGVLRAADNSNVNATEKGSPFGALRTITVSAAGVLDPRGSYAWGYHTINLAGGMISNTVARYGVSSDQYNAASRRDPFNPTISLLDDSILATPVNHNFSGKLKTNGHTLTAWIKSGCSLRWIPDSVPFASVVVTGGGWFYTLKNFTMNEKTFDLTMVNGYFHLGGSLTVSNYLAQAKGNTFDYENNASPTMKVYGTFTPESEHFVGCTMQDGSTIDLSGKQSVWSSQGFTWGKGDVDFAEGAMVTIDVHGRSFTRRTQIVKWTETSATSAAKATFVLDAASKATGLKLASVPYDKANPDVGGLYVERRGLVLIFQ